MIALPSSITPDLIGEIYAAAGEPDCLARLSGIVCGITDSDTAGMWSVRDGEISEIWLNRDQAELIEPYLAYYEPLDPWRIARRGAPGRVTLGTDLIADRDLVRTEFFNDFAGPNGLRRPLGVVLPVADGLVTTVALNRRTNHHPLDDSDKAALQALAPHLTNALRMRRRMDNAHGGGWPSGSLDALAFGLAACDQKGRVLHANAAARRLEADGLLRLSGSEGALNLARGADTDRLHAATQRAAQGVGGAIRAVAGDGIILSILVTPMPGAMAEFPKPRLVMLMITREDAVPSPGGDLLAALFGLSPVQASLCQALSMGKTFEEIAEARGVATSTMRTHLATVLHRTGTRNMRDLLRLLATLPQIDGGAP